jgi:hypothetical protein
MHMRNQAYVGTEPAVTSCCQCVAGLQLAQLHNISDQDLAVTAAHTAAVGGYGSRASTLTIQRPWSKLPIQTHTFGIAAAVGEVAAC